MGTIFFDSPGGRGGRWPPFSCLFEMRLQHIISFGIAFPLLIAFSPRALSNDIGFFYYNNHMFFVLIVNSSHVN